MRARPIDISKKSNRRCCNCGDWLENVFPKDTPWTVIEKEKWGKCLVPTYSNEPAIPKNYWNCCKDFKWREDQEYISTSGGVICSVNPFEANDPECGR